MTQVSEFNPTSNNPSNRVVEGDVLEFPNVQTCLAVVGKKATSLVGVHLTVATRSSPDELAPFLEKFVGCDKLFVLGGVKVGKWSTPEIKAVLNIADMAIYVCDTSKEVVSTGVNFVTFANGKDITMGYGSSGKPFQKVTIGNFKRI